MSNPVQAVERAMQILETFAGSDQSLSIDQVAQQTGLARATAYRLVHTMVQSNHLCADGRSFRLGHGVLTMGVGRMLDAGLTRSCEPVLNSLCTQTGETAVLASLTTPGSNEFVINAVAHHSGQLRVAIDVGQHTEVSRSAIGAALDSTTSTPQALHTGPHDPDGSVSALAVPVLSARGEVLASVAILAPTIRADHDELATRFGPQLALAAEMLSGFPQF